MKTYLFALTSAALLTACQYSPPEDSGFAGLRPFPSDGDICEVVAPSEATASFAQPNALLIACPTHEKGAISDRKADGAVIAGELGAWTLLNLPNS